MESDPRPFLTIIAWPSGLDRLATAQLLADEAGMDLYSLRLRLGQTPPMIVGQAEPDMATRAVTAIRQRGGDAFTATFADLAGLGGTLKIKDLRLEHGALAIDLWRGLSTTLRREQIQILVRAHLSHTKTTRRPSSPHSVGMAGAGGFHLAGGGVGVGLGAAGLAAAYGAAYAGDISIGDVERSITTSDKLDIHTTDGSIYQIDGDKFGYRVLGDLRGHGDNANMNAMCELLSHLAPDPIVDPYFSLWKPPPGHERLRLPDMKINKDDPAFAFYSRWAALMYRHVMGV